MRSVPHRIALPNSLNCRQFKGKCIGSSLAARVHAVCGVTVRRTLDGPELAADVQHLRTDEFSVTTRQLLDRTYVSGGCVLGASVASFELCFSSPIPFLTSVLTLLRFAATPVDQPRKLHRRY
jgi:hypothetical protein